MNEDARKMTPPREVNIDNCELDDDQLSQAAGGADGDGRCVTWCYHCNCSTLHASSGEGTYCTVCGTLRPKDLDTPGGPVMVF